jgi:acyl transferase domain-containing protein
VNSFADGGTNAHVIVEGVPAETPSRRSPRPLPALQRVSMGGPGRDPGPARTETAGTETAQPHPQPASPAASEVVVEGAWE